MNKTIYLATIKKILKHKFVCVMLVFMGIIVPMTMILSPERPSVTSVEAWDAFAVSTVVGLMIVTASNAIGNTLTLGGRSDYMPLIVTRPLHRFQYVLSKFFALATMMIVVSLTQHTILWLSGAYLKWGITTDMIATGYAERIISSFAVSSVLTLIYLLPTQAMVLCGIISFEIATGINVFAMSISMPLPETTSDITYYIADVLGANAWGKTCLLPALFGGTAMSSINQFGTVIVNLSNFLAPQIHLYDMLNARPFSWTPFLEVASNIFIALALATMVLNAREYHYDTD